MIQIISRKDLHKLNTINNPQLKLRIINIIDMMAELYKAKSPVALYGGIIKVYEDIKEFEEAIKNYYVPEFVDVNNNFSELQFMINDDFFHYVMTLPIQEINECIKKNFEQYM